MPRRVHSDGFIVNVKEGNKELFECVLCNSRFVSDRLHVREPKHRALVLANEQPAPRSPDLPPLASELAAIQNALIEELSESNESDDESNRSDESQKSDNSNKSNKSNKSDNLDEEYDELDVHLDFNNINEIPELLLSSLYETEDDDDDIESLDESDCSDSSSDPDLPDFETLLSSDAKSDWYPFKEKEHLVSILLIGSSRNLMARKEFERVRAILTICKVVLPTYNNTRNLRERLKERIGLTELGNPLVSPHLVFIPEAVDDEPVNHLSQSKKWREEYPRDLRVPMIEHNSFHYYIYEPLQLLSGERVVPIHFYQQKGVIFSKSFKLFDQPSELDTGLKLSIPEEEDWNSENYEIISADQFYCPYPNLELSDGLMLKDFCSNTLFQPDGENILSIPLPNPWRIRANGLLIQHIPMILYSDDTSGNVSKKWNKHMSIYTILAGLPPKLANQEFNIHFVATTNTANALELFGQTVAEFNEMSSEGFVAYNSSLETKVFVIALPLYHCGDSPMHAEISNTPNPSMTLNPCRICDLSVESQAKKKTETYIQDFLGLNADGSVKPFKFRDWALTKERTKELWNIVRTPQSGKKFSDLSKKYGIKDSINLKFIQQIRAMPSGTREDRQAIIDRCELLDEFFGDLLFNPLLDLKGFDGHIDTPVECLHVVLLGIVKYLYRNEISNIPERDHYKLKARYTSFNISGLNIPPIIPRTMIDNAKSLVGKEFRVVMQTAAFVLFEHLDEAHRLLWSYLSHLGSYIFQQEIPKLSVYLSELQILIRRFLNQLIKLTAQWTNKPKFHMLLHLGYSIERLGPAILFATEKLESFNRVTREGSIHSNHQSPSHDIAVTSNTHRFFRILFSESVFFDRDLNADLRAGSKFRDLFRNNKQIQKSLGFDLDWNKTPEIKFSYSKNTSPCPPELGRAFPHHKWTPVETAILRKNQQVKAGAFVLIRQATDPNTINECVGCVISVWQGTTQTDSPQNWVEIVNARDNPGVHPFYYMKEFRKSQDKVWIKLNDIHCLLNVQHNCHDGDCEILRSRNQTVERRVIKEKGWQVNHSEFNSYILNCSSFYSAQGHREMSGIELLDVSPEEWCSSVAEGLHTWRHPD
ncbi:hypothetical protein DFH28DRAFT_1194770 [Melampsora americana]|nr:hypothetical protein DFH28DRAFT_1194770 [Melampsora americana]